jgi:hypothetical protein
MPVLAAAVAHEIASSVGRDQFKRLRTQTGSRNSDNGQCVDVVCARFESRACVESRPPTEEPPVFDPP